MGAGFPGPLFAMPSFYLEGDAARPGDSIQRAMVKLNSRLYDAVVTLGGSTTLAMYPEDTRPLPGDDLLRSLNKINALLASLILAMVSGGSSNATGTGSPEGVVTGTAANMLYVELDGNGVVVTFWVFTGTVGTNTGWVSFLGL